MKSRKQVLKKLFLSTLYLSAFTFGGGYVIVTQHSWLSLQEFADLVAIAEMTPGPIAINAATFVGTRLAGVPGALTATLGCILPSCLLLTLLSRLYLRYRELDTLQGVLASLRPAVVAMIASAGVLILTNAVWAGEAVTLADTNWAMAAIFAVCLVLLRKTKLSPTLVMLLAGAVNLLLPA